MITKAYNILIDTFLLVKFVVVTQQNTEGIHFWM